MSAVREGGCSCGAVRYRLTAEPLFVNCCHCRNCQRQTGTAFAINLLIEADRLELGGVEPVEVALPRDDGTTQRVLRCPHCQVALYSHYSRGDVCFVRAGTLDDPHDVVPDVHIFTRSKVPWVIIPESQPAFDVFYDLPAQWSAESLERLAALNERVIGEG
ncbi:MAG: GFA family protein [Gaiella sp.]